jgi:hypothetical protein
VTDTPSRKANRQRNDLKAIFVRAKFWVGESVFANGPTYWGGRPKARGHLTAYGKPYVASAVQSMLG